MTNDDRDFLVDHDGNGHDSTTRNNSNDTEYYTCSESTTIQVSTQKPRSYGSLTDPEITAAERLTYTWCQLDVYGEAPQQRTIASRIHSIMPGTHKIPTPRKQLLKNVSGIARSGEILAVLGSSGAGKTTLLNALAFRSPAGVQVSPAAIRAINGIPVDAPQLRTKCAYVQQEDLFIGSLTPREHLTFQAMLRMRRSMTYRQKMERVDEVISELSLVKCQNTAIGVLGRVKGLSGGERKRLAFASEVLTDPPLLLCDEPTSGLDSFMAASVLQVLKGLAQKGKTIILTIHQPSSELFALFDRILLMAEGRTAFLGTTQEASEFFAQLNAPCPNNYNPVDFYIQLLAIVPGNEGETRQRVQKICDAFATSKLASEVNTMCAIITSRHEEDFYDTDTTFNSYSRSLRYRATWCTQFRAILWRSWLTVLKEPLLVKVRLIQTTMVSLLIGLIFYQQKLNQDGVMNINGAIFLFLTNMTFQNVFAVINVFCAELPVFIRESRSRLYRTDVYFLGKTIAEMPLFLLIPLLFTSIVYPMVGLRAGWTHFGIALGFVALVANAATSFGYLISCISSTVSMALSVAPPVLIPFLLFGGFFLNSGSVPVYLKWLSYMSWFRYGNEGLLINQWADVKAGEIDCTRSNTTCPASGHVILETLNFSEANTIWDILGLVVLIIIFRVFAYIALWGRARSSE